MSRKRPFIVGLTGSIGMGKTTAANMFAELGAAVWDADATVQRLYAKGGAGVSAIKSIRPEAIVGFGVDKAKLKEWIGADSTALAQIEKVIHPLVAADRAVFLDSTTADIVVLDIPLLFETGQETDMDLICVVSTPHKIQRQRVMDRPGMTEQQFELILAKQMPDADKREKADYVVPTETLDGAKNAVQELMDQIRKQLADA